MYTREKPERPFTFASGDSARFAVISSARVDPTTLGGRPDQYLLDSRLRKMVFKHIGFMYFKWPPSSRPRSVMYGPILSLDDLDNTGDDP